MTATEPVRLNTNFLVYKFCSCEYSGNRPKLGQIKVCFICPEDTARTFCINFTASKKLLWEPVSSVEIIWKQHLHKLNLHTIYPKVISVQVLDSSTGHILCFCYTTDTGTSVYFCSFFFSTWSTDFCISFLPNEH